MMKIILGGILVTALLGGALIGAALGVMIDDTNPDFPE